MPDLQRPYYVRYTSLNGQPQVRTFKTQKAAMTFANRLLTKRTKEARANASCSQCVAMNRRKANTSRRRRGGILRAFKRTRSRR